jgi:hypothetical protein
VGRVRVVKLRDHVGQLGAGRNGELHVCPVERLADVAHDDFVGRVADRHGRRAGLELERKRAVEACLILGEQPRCLLVDSAFPEGNKLEALLPGEEARELGLLEQVALEQDFAQALAGARALLQSTLDRLRREEAGSENQGSERRVWTLT